MAIRSARDNILAGGFVVTAVFVAVWISFMLGERSGLGATRKFTVRFPISMGAPGIKPGAPVQLGGQQIGRVTGVSFHPGGAPATGVDVLVEVPASITMYDNAAISLDRPLLGSLSTINISDAGSAADVQNQVGPTKNIDDGDVIPGGLSPPAFLAQAGLGAKQIAEVKHIISTLDDSLTKVGGIVERAGPNAEQGLADAKALVGDLRGKVDGWGQSVDRIAANVERASAKLDPLLTDAQAGVQDARSLIADARAIVADNRQKIDHIVATADSAATKLDQTTIAQLNTALEEGRRAIDAFSGAIDRVASLVSEQTPNVRRTLANLRLMSDNLKLTAIEVRAQPWRVLYTPTTKELSTQTLYDATRAFAEAAGDVRAASEALANLAGGDPTAADGATIKDVSKSLADAAARYHAAEQKLMDALIREEKK